LTFSFERTSASAIHPVRNPGRAEMAMANGARAAMEPCTKRDEAVIYDI